MSDSEFEFEDDEFDSYYEKGADDSQSQVLNQKLAIENAYYEAEDKITRNAEEAAQALQSLRATVANLLQSGSEQLTEAALKGWLLKILRSLIRIPDRDFKDKCAEFKEMQEVLDLTQPSECTNHILTGLETLDHTIQIPSTDVELHLYLDVLQSVCLLAKRLGNSRLWQQAGLRSTRLLLEHHQLLEVEEWLNLLYAGWMNLEDQGSKKVWDRPDFFRTISNASSEELGNLFEIVALDFEFCNSTGVDWRLRRLVRYCDNFSRVMVNRRTLTTLKQSMSHYYFAHGCYDSAYSNLFDAWEANFSLGNTAVAQEQLADLALCNILCGSPIDPLSTREAQTLISQQNAVTYFGGHTLMEVIKALVNIKSACSENEVARVAEGLETPVVNTFLENSKFARTVPVKRELLRQTRRRRMEQTLKLWNSIDLEFLASQLHFYDMRELQHFLVGMTDTLPDNMYLGIVDGILKVYRRSAADVERQELFQSLLVTCDNLHQANLHTA
eukprot:Blabericola_migrator_1__11867@NODE_722_length_6730_cov_58_989494_g520_i0_p1_GENE_NODE_722_length_6730_cov_58_989494_g520_i0NODE_722_length_6730_cov_58_989494_g520_i0_p1_ORF_typecomplete_len500_score84_90DUF1804/PF08822_11/0_035DUF1804/PF08822_11/9_3e03DUF1804/PF08822_11/1_6e03PCI/PF01399_27/4_6e02PCI/PF01399_27/0_13DUF134/PF02001_16/0_13ZnuA/PF01297_17/7_8ZnuA/PF01297_17/67_NODE_722_length_6730_cov_58_989494_g520_i022363735